MNDATRYESLAWIMRVDLTRHAFTRRQLWLPLSVITIGCLALALVAASVGAPVWWAPWAFGAIMAGLAVLAGAQVFRDARNAIEYYCLDENGLTVVKLNATPETEQLVGRVWDTPNGIAEDGPEGTIRVRPNTKRRIPWHRLRVVVLYPADHAITVHLILGLYTTALFFPNEEVYENALDMIREHATRADIRESRLATR